MTSTARLLAAATITVALLAPVAGGGIFYQDNRSTDAALTAAVAAQKEPDQALSADGSLALAGTKLLAKFGIAQAQAVLGARYQYGNGVPKDMSEAVAWYTKAANAGDSTGQLLLGRLSYTNSAPIDDTKTSNDGNYEEYLVGPSGQKLLTISDADAAKWFEKAAGQGNVAAAFLLGEMFLRNERQDEHNTAIGAKWFGVAADQGNAAAQVQLAKLYEIADGVEKNEDKAIALLKKAATQGSVEAEFELGYEYENGHAMIRNPVEAAKWYQLAAEHGNELAQRSIGIMYAKGVGVPRDYVQAYVWLNLAAAKSAGNADEVRNEVEALMTPTQLAEAQKKVATQSGSH